MAYQVLARKWRPQDFASVIGQEPIITALRNALTDDRIAQAYLFSGIRGVGKTTAARVFAKSLNCERGPAADPCNECTICREITAGSDLDVIEVDAATYSKVEQVRELTESLRYGPARDRYKVVVLDEIHRLSRQAFDALLKIIEEPPPHLVFIFATTEIEAVPATILSRCQEFHFRRVASDVVAAHLADLAQRESIEASDAALRLVARAGEGSVRDSVALLDQLATFGGGRIADEDAARLLGGLDSALFERLLAAVLDGDHATVAEVAATVEEEGWDPRHVYSQFVGYCRDALHLAMGGAPERVDLPTEEAARLAERARRAGFENLLRLLHQLLASEETVRRSDAAAIAAEIAWLRAAELPKLRRVEEILGGPLPERAPEGMRPSGGPSESSPAPAPSRQDPVLESFRESGATASRAAQPASAPRPERDTGAATRPPTPTPEPPAAPEPPAPTIPAAPPTGTVEALLDEVKKRKPPLAAHLQSAQRMRADASARRLEITVPPGDETLHNRLQREANRKFLEESLELVFGPGWSWTIVPGAGPSPPRSTPSSGSQPARSAAQPSGPATDEPPPDDDPTVQTVLEIFDGEVESVEPSDPTEPA